MSKQQYELIHHIDSVKAKVISLESEINLHQNHLSTHGGNLSKIDAQIETQLLKTLELQTELQDYKRDYVEMARFQKQMEEFERKHDRLLISLED